MSQPQAKTNTTTAAQNIEHIARTIRSVRADQSGNLPAQIEVLQVGVWRTPYHGDFMITPDDLQQYVDNFKAGVGMVEAGIGLPIDFSHNSEREAAGWITDLFVEEDSLIAKVEWTTAGADALKGGLYKCFSPEFYPRGRGGWCDPENYDTVMDNVLAGGGLTNIPLFKGLQPVMASTSDKNKNGDGDKNVIYIKASKNEKEQIMQLDVVRAKGADELTEDEKQFLVDSKSQLSAEELQKFGFEAAPKGQGEDDDKGDGTGGDGGDGAGQPADKTEIAEPVLASLKSGESVVIKASDLKGLQDTAAEYRNEKAETIVKGHVARGAIRADQLNPWRDRLVKASGTERAEMEQLLANLPDNKVLADEAGSSEAGNATKTAVDEAQERAEKIVADSKGATNYTQALKQVLAADTELAGRFEKEREIK